MRKTILAVVLLSGCSGTDSGTDFAPNFVGTWNGLLATTIDGETAPLDAGYLVITQTGTNAVLIGHFCPDGLNSSGPPATVSSYTIAAKLGPIPTVTFGAYACPPYPQGDCSSSVVSFTGGAGDICDGYPGCGPVGPLSISGNGSTAGCGTSTLITQSFNGAK